MLRDSHPSNQELLLAADGELPTARAEQICAHLRSCPECRVRAQELEMASGEFMRLHRETIDRSLPAAADRRSVLKAQLNAVSGLHEGLLGKRWLEMPQAHRLLLSAGICFLAVVISLSYRSSRGSLTAYAGFIPVSFPTATLTPGVTRPTDLKQLCGLPDEKNREVPAALRRRVFALYGISGADPQAYEVDYLITPALGGADDIGNLWPQSYSATEWNAGVKDALEDRLHQMVCRGDLDLGTAQREISSDWIAAYRKYFGTDRPLH